MTTLAGAAVSMPHARDRREVDAQIGMIIFLASWGMVFLTLFFALAVLRLQSDTWPPLGSRPLPQTIAAVNTGILLVSSLLLHRGVRAVAEGRPQALRVPLGATMLLGAAFLALQIETWLDLWSSGMRMQQGTYESLFYALTAFHGLHVVAGLGVLLWIVPVAGRSATGPTAMRDRIRVRSSAMFWHFVDLAWIATFLAVYVI